MRREEGRGHGDEDRELGAEDMGEHAMPTGSNARTGGALDERDFENVR